MQTVFEKIASGMQSTAVNDDPQTHTQQEMQSIEEYKSAVDPELLQFVEESMQGGKDNDLYTLQPATEKAASEIKKITGVDVSGFKTAIERRQIRHIWKRHGQKGLADQSMSDTNDLARIQYVLSNYDAVQAGGTSSSYTTVKKNGKPAQAQVVVFSKKIDGTYYVAEAVPDTKRKTLFITSAYISKNGQKETGTPQLVNAPQSPVETSETSSASVPVADSIAQSEQSVNGEEVNASRLPDWAAYEAAHKGERYEYDPLEGGVDQTADFELWRDTTYFDAQEYSDTELAEQVARWREIRDNASEENKNRAIAQYHLDAYEYVQAQRAQKNAALEQQNGGMQNAEILNDGSQRDEGLGTRGQSRAVESGASRSISRGEARTQAAIIRDLKTNGRAQSAKEIGVEDGSEAQALYVLSEEQVAQSASWSRIKADAEADGARVAFVVGKIEVYNRGTGAFDTVEGVHKVDAHGQTTYVIRVDGLKRNAEQIYRHEKFHELVSANPGLMVDLMDALDAQYSQQEIVAMVNSYVEAYHGIYGVFDASMTEDEQNALILQYMNEVFADAYAKIQRGARRIDAARKVLSDQTDVVQRAEQNRKAMRNKTAPPRQEYLVDKYYERQIDKWDENDHGGAFRVGSVSEPLLMVGVPNKDIWFDQSKAAKQLAVKQEVTKEILKGIPRLLEKPVAISESYDNTVLVFGELYDRDGNPIVVAVRINSTNRRNHITQVNKIRSVGTRTHNLDNLLKDENILYLNPNKKETNKWFNALGRSTPFGGTKYGLVKSISFATNDVKQEFSFDDSHSTLEDRVSGDDYLNALDLIEEIQSVGAQVDDAGYVTLYHRTSNAAAKAIYKTGVMSAKEDGLFFSTNANGENNYGYGDAVVELNVPAEMLVLDDIFADEASVRIPLENSRRMNVSEYLVRGKETETQEFSFEDDVAELDARYGALVDEGDGKRAAAGERRGVEVVSAMEQERAEENAKARHDEAYHKLAVEKKKRIANEASIDALKGRVKSSETEIQKYRITKDSLRKTGQLTREMSAQMDNRIKLIRETLQIDRAALKAKQKIKEQSEKKKREKKQEEEIQGIRARTAQKEIKMDFLNLFSANVGWSNAPT